MKYRFTINPLNITGNQPLSVEVDIENFVISSAKIGVRGYWNFERMLEQKDPFDSLQVVLRMNSNLSASHALAAVKAIEDAGKIKTNDGSLLARNIIHSCEYIKYHLSHFYQGLLFSFDRFEELKDNYWQALRVRERLQELIAVLSGKEPHGVSIVPGGISENINISKIISISSFLDEIEEFINVNYLNDVRKLAQLYPEWTTTSLRVGNYLCVGAFPQSILKDGSEGNWYYNGVLGLNGDKAKVLVDRIKVDDTYSWDINENGIIDKKAAYSWVKAARYEGDCVETGVLARYIANNTNRVETAIETGSVFGREFLRVGECADLLKQVRKWANMLSPDLSVVNKELIRLEEGLGIGVVESPAGPVCHKVRINKSLISSYEIIDPVSFNFSPMDSAGAYGIAEQALTNINVKTVESPNEILHVLRALE